MSIGRRSVLGAALVVTAITVLARVGGLGRNFVFARAVGFNCVSDTYATVNTVPNILYEILAGGALASLVVPLLAIAVAGSDREQVSRTSSALLTWTVCSLTVVSVVVAVAAHPISSWLLGAKDCPGAVDVGASMLRVFAPQIVLYGVGIVFTGILQAHRRFGAPAVAPLLSSLVVICAYVGYALVTPADPSLVELSTVSELMLSVGTTLGVVALTCSLIVPLSGLGLALRPTWQLPHGIGSRARALGAAGVTSLTAQQMSVVVALLLSNAHDVPAGSTAAFFQAQTVYYLPWAVLAVPLATSAFPRLTQLWGLDRRSEYRLELAAATRATVTLALVATAGLVAAADPIARVIAQSAPGEPAVEPVAHGIAAFAFGLTGYALFALLSRALYATHAARNTAIACLGGWLAVIVADLVLAGALDGGDRVLALALGNSVGMTLLGVSLMVATLHRAGNGAFSGLGAAALVAVGASVLSGALGWWVAQLWSGGGIAAALAQTLAVGAVVVAVFAGTMFVLARETTTQTVAVLRRRGMAHSHE